MVANGVAFYCDGDDIGARMFISSLFAMLQAISFYLHTYYACTFVMRKDSTREWCYRRVT